MTQYPFVFSSIENGLWDRSSKTKQLWSQRSHCIFEDIEAQREVTNLKSSNLKSRLLSLNYIFSLLITASYSSQQAIHRVGNLTGLSMDLLPDSIATWPQAALSCFNQPSPCSFSSQIEIQTSPWHNISLHTRKSVSLNWPAALKVSGLTFKVVLDLWNAHQWIGSENEETYPKMYLWGEAALQPTAANTTSLPTGIDQTACLLGSKVLQLETAALHHQLYLLLHGAGCLLSAQHVLWGWRWGQARIHRWSQWLWDSSDIFYNVQHDNGLGGWLPVFPG